MIKQIVIVPFLCLLFSLSVWCEDVLPGSGASRPTSMSVMSTIAVANSCIDLGLTHEEAVATSNVWQEIKDATRPLPGERRIKSTGELIQVQNDIIRSAVRDILGASRVKRHNEAYAQYAFSELRPDWAFEWLEIPRTEEQQKALETINVSDKLVPQVAKDRVQVVIESMQDVVPIAELEKKVGEPFTFKHPTLLEPILAVFDLDPVPDAHPVLVLASPHVQIHLELTAEQVQKVTKLASSYRKLGYFPEDPYDFKSITAERLEEIRTKAILDAENILTETQRPRFRELVLQRYLFAQSPDYALRYLGIKVPDRARERYEGRRDVLYDDLENVRRLRIVLDIRDEVGEIMGRDLVRRVLGKPSFLSASNDAELMPKLDSSVMREIVKAWGENKRVNPRRQDRQLRAGRRN